MSPSPNESSGLNLPPPVSEQLPPTKASERPAGSEQPSAPAEKAPSRGQTAPIATPPIPLPSAPVKSTKAKQTDDSTTTKAPSLDDSDETDLIDKEWVNKAKAIVERTRDNPYQQTEELTVVKADYLKKRYDKTLKLNK